MLVTIIPNFALFSYPTTYPLHYQLYGYLAPCLKTHEGFSVDIECQELGTF